jgi:hypothetical protein
MADFSAPTVPSNSAPGTGFDTEFNSQMHQNVQDNTTISVGALVGGAVATTVDVGTSLWNSLPLTENMDTADILKRVSTDALQVYNEDPDLIHTASFVAGMFIPSTIGLKGINILRNGVKGASWFGSALEANRATEVANVARMFEEAGAASSEYRTAMRSFYAKNAVNQAIDAVAMEAAIVGMYNAHPYMEDYMQDLPKNFAISAAFGGVIGGTIGHVADRFALRAATGEVAEKVFGDTVGKLRPVYGDMSNTVALQSQEINIRRLDAIMEERAAAGKNETNDLTFAVAKTVKQNTVLEQNELLDTILDGDLKNLPIDKKNQIKDFLVNNPETAGAESIRLLNQKDFEASGLVTPPSSSLASSPTFSKINSKGVEENVTAVYYPELGLYGTTKDAVHYAGASVYGMTGEQLGKQLPKNFGRIPNLDSALELASKGSSEIQKEYIAALYRVKDMSLDEFKKLTVSETDGPTLNAILNRMANDPEAAKAGIKVVRDNKKQVISLADDLEKELHSTEPYDETARAYNISTQDAITAAVSRVGESKFFELVKKYPISTETPEWEAISIEMTARKIEDFYAAREQQALNLSNKIDLDTVNKVIIQQKQDAINSLLVQGVPVESIAIKTNTAPEIVRAYLALKNVPEHSLDSLIPAGQNVSSLSLIRHVTDAENILDPINMPLVMKGNLLKNQNYIQNHIGLDNLDVHNINKLVTSQLLRGSKSKAANDVAELLDNFGPSLDIVRNQIGKINNELAGTAFFNSFDFFARKMGDVGPVISLVGKEFQRIGNDLRNRIVEPLTKAMEPIAKDAVALIEFNTAMDVNASLAGWRNWTADGYLVQKTLKETEEGQKLVFERVQAGGRDYQIKSKSVLDLLLQMQGKSAELRDLKNASRKLIGKGDIADIGFWAPSFNPVNKFIAYAHNALTDETKLLWARTEPQFKEIVNTYKKHLAETGQTNINVYTKDEQKYWSLLNGRLDTVNMQRADLDLYKKGATSNPIPKSNQEIFGEIAGGYQHYISAEMRNIADLSLADITDPLRAISALNQASTAAQPFDKIKRAVTQPKDAAAVVHNTLLGSPNLGEYGTWQSVNQNFETLITMASNKMADVYNATVKPLAKTFFGGTKELTVSDLSKIDYNKVKEEMDKRGIYNPYAVFDDAAAKMFGLSKIEDHKDTAKRVVYASNALAATALLRVGELAQPLVNAMSMPILASLAIADRMPATFLGAQKGTAKVSGVQVMYEGMRSMNSPLFKPLNAKWEKMGIFTPMVSEVNDLQRASRQFEPGMVSKIENALDSAWIKTLSKPADFTESFTRKAMMNTGAVLAKRLYPELDDTGITIFARDFMDKALGNFHASQRPVFFQGTLGVALGLFQTYSLTLAQSIYRHLELKNYKALGTAALLQSGIFGTESMPGFNLISQQIGKNFSDEHFDLSTGTYRAVGEPLGNFLLYGLPSNIGGGSYTTRGDVNPRAPLFNPPVAWSVISQTMDMMKQVQKGLSGEVPDMGRALGQALSLQNMSRPLARASELATGYSITKQGNTVQTPEEVWTTTGIIARIMATRPLEDAKIREADHMRRFYAAIDHDNRQEAMDKIRTAVRNGTLTDEKLAKVADDYFRKGGSPRGWNSSVNTAVYKTDTSGRDTFLMKLAPNSPLNYMIDNLDGS